MEAEGQFVGVSSRGWVAGALTVEVSPLAAQLL